MSTQEVTYVTKHFDSHKEINGVIWRLSNLAAAFDETGNDRMYNAISEMAKDLQDALELNRESFHEMQSIHGQFVEESSNNMYRAALAVTMNAIMETEES